LGSLSCQVCTLEHRSMGRSTSNSGQYTIATLAADVRSLLLALGWNDVHVAGISLGGMIAQELASDDIARGTGIVASLFLSSTTSGVSQRSWSMWNDWLRRWAGSKSNVWYKLLPKLRNEAEKAHWICTWVLGRSFSLQFLESEAYVEFCKGSEEVGDEDGLERQHGVTNRDALQHLYGMRNSDYITHNRSSLIWALCAANAHVVNVERLQQLRCSTVFITTHACKWDQIAGSADMVTTAFQHAWCKYFLFRTTCTMRWAARTLCRQQVIWEFLRTKPFL